MAFQQPGEGALVLIRGKGAGGVDEPSARGEHLQSGIQDLILAAGTEGDILFAPLLQSHRLLAEHSLAGAGSVHDNAVKEAREPLCQPVGGFIQHSGIADAHALHIPGEDSGTLGVDLIGDEQAAISCKGGQMAGLAAGSGTEVQHSLAGPGSSDFRHCHGAGLLNIVDPGIMPGVKAGTQFPVIAASGGTPFHRGSGEGQFQVRVRLEQVQPEPPGSGLVITVQKGLIFIAEHLPHTGQKGFGQLHVKIYLHCSILFCIIPVLGRDCKCCPDTGRAGFQEKAVSSCEVWKNALY